MEQGKMHLSRPPAIARLRRLIGSGVKSFFMPASCFERLSSKARGLLDLCGAEVIIESSRGRPINITPEMLLEIVELHRDNMTYRQIEQITKIPKSTVHYLIKYA